MQRIVTKNLGSCIGYTGTSATHDQSLHNRSHSILIKYNPESLFYGRNYRRIINGLNGGYGVSTNLIGSMKDYRKLLQENIHRHTSFSKKWRSKINHQSSLSSYHTTKRAQLQTIQSFDTLAQLSQPRCDAIQQVIETYREQVQRMYPAKRLGMVHKHYQSDILEQSFETAYSPLSEVSNELKKLRKQEKKAIDALHEADVQCENLSFDETTSKNKPTRVNEKQKKNRDELKEIQEKIFQAEEKLNKEQEIYYEKATDIYNQCRELEKERLDQIRQTLILFIQATHTPEHSDEYNTIFEDLLSNIKTQQDSVEDLNFWAQTYHVDTLPATTNENNDANTTDSLTTVRKPTPEKQNENASDARTEDDTDTE